MYFGMSPYEARKNPNLLPGKKITNQCGEAHKSIVQIHLVAHDFSQPFSETNLLLFVRLGSKIAFFLCFLSTILEAP